jgi:hypothetical protein
MNTPTQTLGSNQTIGAYWLCEDNISGIKKMYIKVGTDKNDNGNKEDENLIARTNIGFVSEKQIDLPDNVYFEDRKTYFVNLEIYNNAGLSTVHSCNVSTILSPPDVSQVDSTLLYSSGVDPETGAVYVNSLDRFGISWKNKKNDTEYYSEYKLFVLLQIKDGKIDN